jgi:hypothetical protein
VTGRRAGRYGDGVSQADSITTRPGDEVLLRRILADALRGRSVRVFLFGSRARGDARRAADFDVALLPEETLSRDLLSGIREALEDSAILARVDLVDLTDAPAALRDAVLREGREWNVYAPD